MRSRSSRSCSWRFRSWMASPALAQQAVVVVRHAEKISETDERLSEAGRARAERLAAMLKDAGVTAIYATDTERAKDTAKPLADARKLTVQIYDVGSEKVNARAFATKVRQQNVDGVVLIVGHSNTVPAILTALGCREPSRSPRRSTTTCSSSCPRARTRRFCG